MCYPSNTSVLESAVHGVHWRRKYVTSFQCPVNHTGLSVEDTILVPSKDEACCLKIPRMLMQGWHHSYSCFLCIMDSMWTSMQHVKFGLCNRPYSYNIFGADICLHSFFMVADCILRELKEMWKMFGWCHRSNEDGCINYRSFSLCVLFEWFLTAHIFTDGHAVRVTKLKDEEMHCEHLVQNSFLNHFCSDRSKLPYVHHAHVKKERSTQVCSHVTHRKKTLFIIGHSYWQMPFILEKKRRETCLCYM